MEKDALLSQCRAYRYCLWRQWDLDEYDKGTAAFIGLNPSTADENEDDPTIRRCVRFAQLWGYSRLLMLNAYAFRATDPKKLKTVEEAVGPRNNEILAQHSAEADLVIACWGANCPDIREQEVLSLIKLKVHCLGKTKHGKPKHPLYLKSDTRLEIFKELGSVAQ